MEHVLLTGFPGLLAESLIRRCQEAERAVFWHLIVSPEDLTRASRRLGELGLAVYNYALYPGDITRPDLGLEGQDAQKLQAQVERCFHLASLYDLTAPPAMSETANVRATRRIAEFLTRCPRLRKFNHVSTCFISGTLEGEIAEDVLPGPTAFRNEYERTRFGAEQVVRDYLEKIPTTIFRPAVIVGDSQTGETSRFDGPYVWILFFKWGRRLFYRMPNLGFETSWLNCVPIDFVSTIFREVGFSDEFVGKTLQVADPAPPTTLQGFEALHQQVSGRRCVSVPDRLKRLVLWSIRRFPFDLITGIPSQSVDYFDHRARYRTDNLQDACQRFGIDIPKWSDFHKPVVRFALTERRHAPNAAVLQEFRRWCSGFRFLYAIVGILFLAAPNWVTALLTLLDDKETAAALLTDNLLWRPLGVSLIVTLFVSVTFLRRDPFQKALHVLIIGAKLISSTVFFAYAASLAAVSLVACGLIDGLIGLFHVLFYYRLSRIREMSGAGLRWDPYHLLFPTRFLEAFTDAMAPELDDPMDVRLAAETVRAAVRRLPFLVRYGFVLSCYYVELFLPCLWGFRPFFLMDRVRRRQFLKRAQHARGILTKMPLVFTKLVCSPHLYKQKPYLRSIGAD